LSLIVVQRGKGKTRKICSLRLFDLVVRTDWPGEACCRQRVGCGESRSVQGLVSGQGDLTARWRRRWRVLKRPTSPLDPAACCTTVRPLWPGCTVPAIRDTKRCGRWVWRTAWCYQKSQARGVGRECCCWVPSAWTSSTQESMDEEDAELEWLECELPITMPVTFPYVEYGGVK
jgi:hypothetical protein